MATIIDRPGETPATVCHNARMTPLPTWAVTVLIVLIVGSWMMFWVAMFRAIARLGGWGKLAEHYRADRPTVGTRWRWRSLTLGRWCAYNNGVTVIANDQGLSLSLPWVFAFGHDELFIPWKDMKMEVARHLFTQVVRLTTSRVPAIPIAIPMKLARRIAESVPAAALPLH